MVGGEEVETSRAVRRWAEECARLALTCGHSSALVFSVASNAWSVPCRCAVGNASNACSLISMLARCGMGFRRSGALSMKASRKSCASPATVRSMAFAMAVHGFDSRGHFPRSMSTHWSTPVVPSERSPISACVKSRATRRRRSASAHTSAAAISRAAERDIWEPPAATAAEREMSAGLAGLLA
jgi:hypothetical protein